MELDPWTGQPSAEHYPSGTFCGRCHYDLRGSTTAGRCPECGADFDPQNPASFLDRLPTPTHWSSWLMWGFLVCVVAVVVAGVIQFMAAAQQGGH